MGEIHELFVLPLFLVWFAGATPEWGVKDNKNGFAANANFPFWNVPTDCEGSSFWNAALAHNACPLGQAKKT